MTMLMRFRRKSRRLGDEVDAGPMIVNPSRRVGKGKVYGAGDEIVVPSIEHLPGYPNAIDGWRFVANVDQAGRPSPSSGSSPDSANAKLKILHAGGDRWRVVIESPGWDYLDMKTGNPVAKNQKVHPGFISRERAEAWVRTGADPGPAE